MTGLSRWAIALIGLFLGAAAIIASVVLVGAANLCGFDENQVETGYCAAGDTLRLLLVAVPTVTVIVGYAISLWTGRLTPIAIAALCAVGAALVALGAGY